MTPLSHVSQAVRAFSSPLCTRHAYVKFDRKWRKSRIAPLNCFHCCCRLHHSHHPHRHCHYWIHYSILIHRTRCVRRSHLRTSLRYRRRLLHHPPHYTRFLLYTPFDYPLLNHLKKRFRHRRRFRQNRHHFQIHYFPLSHSKDFVSHLLQYRHHHSPIHWFHVSLRKSRCRQSPRQFRRKNASSRHRYHFHCFHPCH
uniref:Uncharacterized protein n=1 Tax=Rhipicephalus zambeziensis TaxID=60191 RepID=A0A224YHC9_9ACAR